MTFDAAGSVCIGLLIGLVVTFILYLSWAIFEIEHPTSATRLTIWYLTNFRAFKYIGMMPGQRWKYYYNEKQDKLYVVHTGEVNGFYPTFRDAWSDDIVALQFDTLLKELK